MTTPKKPAHRPLKWGEPTEKLTIYLPASLAAKIREEADGDVSKAIIRKYGYKKQKGE